MNLYWIVLLLAVIVEIAWAMSLKWIQMQPGVASIGTSLVLGFLTPLEGVGVWIGLATGLTVAAALLIWRWTARDRLGLTGPPAAP